MKRKKSSLHFGFWAGFWTALFMAAIAVSGIDIDNTKKTKNGKINENENDPKEDKDLKRRKDRLNSKL